MAQHKGQCANYKKCKIADSGTIIQRDDENFICPSCKEKLVKIDNEEEQEEAKIDTLTKREKISEYIVNFFGKSKEMVKSTLTNFRFSNFKFTKNTILWIVAIAILLLGLIMQFMNPFSNNENNTSIETQKIKAPTHNVILRLHGSNTIGAKLAPALVEGFLHDKGYIEIKTVPLANLEILITGKKPNSTQIDAIEIKSHGSSTAFEETDKNAHVGLLKQYADIGMSSSPVKDEIITHFNQKNLGDLSSKTQEHIIALDGLAIVVHPNNPLKDLTLEQLEKIFLGKIQNWSELNVTGGKIKVYSRDEQSGTYDTLKNLVLHGEKIDCKDTQRVSCFEDSKELSANVTSDENGIGFIGLNYVGLSKPLNIKSSGGVEPISPTLFNIKTENYPLSRRLFLYQTNHAKPLENEFIQFVLSDNGQKIVNKAGLVNISIDDTTNIIKDEDAQKATILNNPAIPSEYKELIKEASRKEVPMNFRFKSSSSELDNKAFRDIGRLSEKLSHPEFANIKLLLIGFSDPKGDKNVNLELSKQRAIKVKQELQDAGLRVDIATGFGAEPSLLLDAREDNNASLAKNRRVEVWLQAN